MEKIHYFFKIHIFHSNLPQIIYYFIQFGANFKKFNLLQYLMSNISKARMMWFDVHLCIEEKKIVYTLRRKL